MRRPQEPEHHRALRRRLAVLTAEHRDLDDKIREVEQNAYVDQITIRRLKKRKLQLRDEIVRIKSDLIPDLNA